MCKICSGNYRPLNNLLGPFVLDISNCFNVEIIPEYENNFIECMIINKNKNLKSLPNKMPCLQKIGLYFLDHIDVPNYLNLREIKLINVNINKLPDDLSILESLYIQNTNVDLLPNNMNKLKQLTINKTPISLLPMMNSIESIQLFKTKITSLNVNLISLKVLNLSKNTEILEVPSSYINLEELYITMSRINRLPTTLTKLKKLYAHKCPLLNLNKEFVSLEEIDVTYSNIKIIPKEYVNIKSITYDEKKTIWDSSWYIEDEEKYKVIILQRYIRKYLAKKRLNCIKLIIRWFRRYNNCSLYSNDNILLLYKIDKDKYNIYVCNLSNLYQLVTKINSTDKYFIFKSKFDNKDVKSYLKGNRIVLKYNTIYSSIHSILYILFESNKIYLNNTINIIIRKLIKIDNLKLLKESIKEIVCQLNEEYL